MPAPLIVAAVVALATLVVSGLGVVIHQLLKSLANKKLAILGAQRVGKTTLFQTLRDGKPPKSSKRTVDPEPGMEFTLRMGRRDVRFEMPKDLPGHDGVAFPAWRAAFKSSDHVWYVFRADLIASGDLATINLVKSHLDLFKTWLTAMNGAHPKIILIGNFADKIDGYPQNRQDFLREVANSAPIKAAVVKLGDAGLVVGSLATYPMAKAMIRGIKDEIA